MSETRERWEINLNCSSHQLLSFTLKLRLELGDGPAHPPDFPLLKRGTRFLSQGKQFTSPAVTTLLLEDGSGLKIKQHHCQGQPPNGPRGARGRASGIHTPAKGGRSACSCPSPQMRARVVEARPQDETAQETVPRGRCAQQGPQEWQPRSPHGHRVGQQGPEMAWGQQGYGRRRSHSRGVR